MPHDPDTLSLALVYLADQRARGKLTDEQYDAAVADLQGDDPEPEEYKGHDS